MASKHPQTPATESSIRSADEAGKQLQKGDFHPVFQADLGD
jgi:hypothetical protein